mmetsp:Transcript_54662/g.160779  ORF Transcript_54662/g.160779 Transcript_54662/m.160779 type:complete len:217 (-) Transcript_54662:294-944(-)
MQKSRCSTSSCCCFFSSATILSISALTSVKASNCARVASRESASMPVAAAARSRTVATCLRIWRCCSREMDSACRKDVASVFPKAAKELSSFRILIVSSTAAISVMRSLTRWSNSEALLVHLSVRFARKVWSRPSCFSVASSSLKASACFSFSSAICWSSSETIFLPAAISSSLAALSARNSSTACFSLAWLSLRSFAKSSFICERMPVIWPLCGA